MLVLGTYGKLQGYILNDAG